MTTAVNVCSVEGEKVEELFACVPDEPALVPFILICVLWKHVMIALPIPMYDSTAHEDSSETHDLIHLNTILYAHS